MHYSSALVLGTLAASSAAAAHNGRHASFHARRQAESKRDLQDVDWSKVSYDLSGINWSTVVTTPQATPAPTQAHAAAVVQSKAPSSAAPVVTPSSAPSKAASSSKAAAPSPSSSASSGTSGDFTKGVSAFFSALGVSTTSSNQKSGNIYVGDGSAWKAKFVNGGGDDVFFTCWEKNKGGTYGGMSINAQAPAIAAYLGAGDELTVSFGADVPAACAPLKTSTKLAMFGGVDNTWWEVTFGSTGAFDVSRNVNMNGSNISSKGSKCTSDMDTCVFKCKDASLPSCTDGYDLFNCNASNGGGGGADANQGGATGGGCAMGATGETVTVTFT